MKIPFHGPMQNLSSIIDSELTAIKNRHLITISNTKDHSPVERDDVISDSDVIIPLSSTFDSDSRIFGSELDSYNENTSDSGEANENEEEEEPEKYLHLDKSLALTIVTNSGRQIVYQYKTKLAQGAYGQVIHYVQNQPFHPSFPKNLCLKVGLKIGDLDSDMEIIENLPKNKSTDLIESLPLICECSNESGDDSVAQPILLMSKMDGTLKNLFKEMVFPSLVDKYWMITGILFIITRGFLQLAKQNIFYTDIKISNCLYKLQNGSHRTDLLTVTLGDIGSAFSGDKRDALATYPNTYRSRCHHFTPIVFDLQYGLLILLFEMLTIVNSKNEDMALDRELFTNLYHQNVKELSVDQRILIIKSLFGNLPELPGTNSLILKFVETVKEKLYFGTSQDKTLDPVPILKELLGIWKVYNSHFAKHSKMARVIHINGMGD